MKILSFCSLFILFSFTSIAQYPTQGSKEITNRSALEKGWVIIGANGSGLNVRYTVIESGRFGVGDVVYVCYLDNIEYSADWEKVSYEQSGCGQCNVVPPGGVSRSGCWRFKKKTPKTIFSNPPPPKPPTGSPQQPAPEVRAPVVQNQNTERLGRIGFYTDYAYGCYLYIYMREFTTNYRRYQTGHIPPLPALFAVRADKLVYAGRLGRYYTPGTGPSNFEADGVLPIVLTEGAYKAVVYDEVNLMRGEMNFYQGVGQHHLQLIRPTVKMAVPPSPKKPEISTVNEPEVVVPPPSEEIMDELDRIKDSLNNSYPYQVTLSRPYYTSSLYDIYKKVNGKYVESVEKTVRIRIKNYSAFTNWPKIIVKVTKANMDTERITMSRREISVRGLIVGVVAYSTTPPIQLEYSVRH